MSKINMFNEKYGGAFRWYKGKRLLADLRGGDYAHAGGEEAIERIFKRFSKNTQRTILDVGCGQGGSANFIQKHSWGQVVGIDLEESSIEYAKHKYPDVTFFVGDASDQIGLQKILQYKKFDIIYMMHSFCVFPQQFEALQVTRKFAHDQTTLIIFEYDDMTNGDNPLKRTDDPFKYFNVVGRDEFKKMLSEVGWKVDDTDVIDVTLDFQRWYEDLLNNLKHMKVSIIKRYGEKYFENAEKRYGGMLEAIKQKKLGGCIIYATTIE